MAGGIPAIESTLPDIRALQLITVSDDQAHLHQQLPMDI
jgi:hypothetical protein